MTEKFDFTLKDVQKTLLLPLWGRATETQKKAPLLFDVLAVDIINKINYDFTAISKNTSEISQLGWIARSLSIDKIVLGFIKQHPNATIVNIGCGFDTTFDRVDNGSIYWFDMDLPDVIELRRRFIPESDRRKFISGSFLDNEWFEHLKKEENMLFIAAGVLYYFEEHQIKDFFKKLSYLFPGSEIVFDASSHIGIKMANKMVIKSNGMDEKSFLKWGIKNAKEILKWNLEIKILSETSLFGCIKKYQKFESKVGIIISDIFKMQYLIHLRLGAHNK